MLIEISADVKRKKTGVLETETQTYYSESHYAWEKTFSNMIKIRLINKPPKTNGKIKPNDTQFE